MIRKSLPLLGSSILIFLLAACAGAAQSTAATESRPSGIWPVLFFLLLAIFFWAWLRQSDNQPEALSASFKMRTQEGVADTANSVQTSSAKPASGKDVIVEDPVRVSRLTDKQKKAQKKGPAGEDDYTIVEGIGPKINGILHGAGLITYTDLANTAVDQLRQILATNSLQYHDPGTWSEQSGLAAAGKWEELEQLQSTLSGGKRK